MLTPLTWRFSKSVATIMPWGCDVRREGYGGCTSVERVHQAGIAKAASYHYKSFEFGPWSFTIVKKGV